MMFLHSSDHVFYVPPVVQGDLLSIEYPSYTATSWFSVSLQSGANTPTSTHLAIISQIHYVSVLRLSVFRNQFPVIFKSSPSATAAAVAFLSLSAGKLDYLSTNHDLRQVEVQLSGWVTSEGDSVTCHVSMGH